MKLRQLFVFCVGLVQLGCAVHTNTEFEAHCSTQAELRALRSCMVQLSASYSLPMNGDEFDAQLSEVRARCAASLCHERRRTCSWSVTGWGGCTDWKDVP